MNWSQDELVTIIKRDDLKISPYREDGVTFGTPTWIWAVAIDGELYVRAYNGTGSRWYQAAIRQQAGRISAAGTVRQVSFEAVSGDINDRIDDAYRAKYNSSSYLAPMLSARVRLTTVRIRPAEVQ